MCGICGIINFNGMPVDKMLIGRMASTLYHRGPDHEGIYVKENAGLGHRRLSIIDLSAAGHQPMCNENATVWIVFNGEIYNFKDLRTELETKGHVFRSSSDTETVLHLYEEEGTDCVKRLRGMFAFAIWDECKKTLFLARDRVGKKPLYYYLDDDRIIFASEIKAILQDPAIRREPDLTAIHHYLTYQSVPSPFSAFRGIKKLAPAHYMVCKSGAVESRQYWRLPYLPKYTVNTFAEQKNLEETLVEKLREAVRIRLISDVPIGAFLSGGLDSSAVVALMSREMAKPVRTFSIGFDEGHYDELKYARMVAGRFKTDHTEFTVRPDAVEVLPKLIWHYNEPFADPSAIPSYYVAKLAREHVTVVLNGDGGDENFAGYDRYAANELAMRLDRLPSLLRQKILPFLFRLMPFSRNAGSLSWRLKRFAQMLPLAPGLRNAHWLCHFDNEGKERLYTPDFMGTVGEIDSFDILAGKYEEAEADNFLDRALYADVNLYLPDTLLVKMDIASMANSLEARSPFLDHEFMEFAARIPAPLKLRGLSTKFILKSAFGGILPPEILQRTKMGFGVPLDSWFRKELKSMAYDTLLGRKCIERGYFNERYVRGLLDEHISGKWNWQYRIYDLLMLELWHREFIDEGSTSGEEKH